MSACLAMTGFFQVGYIINDLEEGMSAMKKKYGIERFMTRRHNSNLATAHCFVDGLMIELIESRPGSWAVYDGYCPPTRSGARLHHHGYLVTDPEQWELLCEGAAASGLARFDAEAFGGDLKVIYLDTREDLGIFSEYIFLGGSAAGYYDTVLGDRQRKVLP
jgi:hypothetical protein